MEDFHGWNVDQYQHNAGRSLEAIVDDFHNVHHMLLRMVHEYNEKALTDHRRYSWMLGEPLSYLIEENASLHDREHADDIRAWREREGL
ncbi:MAG: ClbS/DfsB family four-helix bundle protein [Anaerolineae bacterium]